MMGASSRRPASRPGSSGGGITGLSASSSSSSSNGGVPSISIRTSTRAGSFNPSRRPVLLRFSPRLVIFALIATICGLWTLLSPQQTSSFFSSSSSPVSTSHERPDSQNEPPAIVNNAKTGSPQLPEMVHHETPLADPTAAEQHQKALPKIKGQQLAVPLAHVGPAVTSEDEAITDSVKPISSTSSKKPNPFDTYLCAGDEWQVDEDNVYTKPFRFHVYQNMPDHLLKDVVERAAHWWQPDNAANQFITEVQIYKYLALHPCHTDDPLEADVFIVPAQTVSGIWLSREKGPNGEPALKDEGASYMKEVLEWIKSQRTGKRFDGRDHYVVSVPWWMGGRPYGGHVNLIGVEVPISFGTHQSFSDTLYLRASNDIIIPYPDPDSYEFYTDEMLDTVKKDLHMVFVGQNRVVAPVRQKVWDQLKAYNERRGDRPKALWHHLKNRDAIGDVKKKTARAIFGPVMKGDSYSSRRLFSLLFAGTIPVIICDYCMLPYQDMLDYSKFAIFLPESEVLDNPDYDIFDVLDSIPQKELDRLRRNGRIVKKHFIFNEGKPQPGDAFDMMVRELALTHLRNRGLKAMMLRGYGEDDEQNYPLQEALPVPGQELVFAGPGVPEAALKIRAERERQLEVPVPEPVKKPLPKAHVAA